MLEYVSAGFVDALGVAGEDTADASTLLIFSDFLDCSLLLHFILLIDLK